MIKNSAEYEKFIHDFERKHPMNLEQKFNLYDSMYDLAKQFGHFTPEKIMDGIDNVIMLAKRLNKNV